jgi:hypothetical protein
MSTPTTLNPAIVYPTLAPPAQQKRSSSLGFFTRFATVLVLGMEAARLMPFFGEAFAILDCQSLITEKAAPALLVVAHIVAHVGADRARRGKGKP